MGIKYNEGSEKDDEITGVTGAPLISLPCSQIVILDFKQL
jgi:hypothetical protein